MQKSEIKWIAVLVVLAVLYVHFFTHWHDKAQIGIEATLRLNRRGGGKNPPMVVTFSLNNDYALTSLKVVPLNGKQFNPNAMPAWHLVSDSNSAPVRAFIYGTQIKGMVPALKGVKAEPLLSETNYRLILTTKEATGYKDFTMH